jgi:hypothetical protein
MRPARRFPPPWTIEEHNAACFIVRDATGQALGYFYFEDEPGRRSVAKLLTCDKARRVAVNFAKAAGTTSQALTLSVIQWLYIRGRLAGA